MTGAKRITTADRYYAHQRWPDEYPKLGTKANKNSHKVLKRRYRKTRRRARRNG